MEYYITIVTGFRENQRIDIPMQEAHKAYHLFRNPNERGVFENGIAIIGRNIQEIIPNWNKTMGWNETYELGNDDWNQIHKLKVDEKMKSLLNQAKKVADLIDQKPQYLKEKLENILEEVKFPELTIRN